MAAGTGRLWDSNCHNILPLRKYVEDNWLKIATNSQLAERWVKDSNECTATSKDEKMSNIYAIIRSHTVMSFNSEASLEYKDRVRKATKHFTQGRLGERIDKRTGMLEIVDDKKRDEIRGSMLIETIIKRTIELQDEVIQIDATEDVRKQIYSHLVTEASQFNAVQRMETTTALAFVQNQPNKPLNAIQRMSGIEITPHARREIKYTKCLTKHIDLLRAELIFRGVTFNEKAKVMELKRLLKKDNTDRQRAAILQKTNVPARDDDLDFTYFKPLHQPAVEWGSAYHVE